MELKKINKKGMMSITSVVISVILVIGIFITFFGFWNEQMQNNNVQIDSKYNETYSDLLEVQNGIDSDINDIKNNINNIEEADENFLAAWNGFKALGSTVKLTVNFLPATVQTAEVVAGSSDFIPIEQRSLFLLAIIVVVTLLILALLTGGNPKI